MSTFSDTDSSGNTAQEIATFRAKRSGRNTLTHFDLHELTAIRERQFPQIFELFRVVGIHMTKAVVPLNPYTGKPHTQTYPNIGEHSVAVTYPIEKIMNALTKSEHTTRAETVYAIERGLLHDTSKPYEIMRNVAKEEGLLDEAYTESAYDGLIPLLKAQNMEARFVEYLRDAGKEAGHLSIAHFIKAGNAGAFELVEGKLIEKVVHLADGMTSTNIPTKGKESVTKFLKTSERMKNSHFESRYPWLWTKGIGINYDGEIVHLKDINNPDKSTHKVLGSYAELQKRVARMICFELQTRISPEVGGDPEAYIKSLVLS